MLLALLIGDSVVQSWDLATAIGVDPGLDEHLVEFAYGTYVPIGKERRHLRQRVVRGTSDPSAR